MTRRPLKFYKLTKALIANKPFLKTIQRTKRLRDLQKIVLQASPEEIFLISDLIRAHLCNQQKLKISQKEYNEIERAKKLKHINSHFGPNAPVETLDKTRKAVLKTVPILRIFVCSVLKKNGHGIICNSTISGILESKASPNSKA